MPEQPTQKIEERQEEEGAAWADSDDEAVVDLNAYNMFKKLKKGDDKITQKELRQRLKLYHSETYAGRMSSWAKQGTTHD